MPEAPALGGALDEPGDVGDHQLVVVEAGHSEVGLEGGEGVVGDLGLGRRDPRDQGALAGVGEPHQGHVGHEPELQLQPALLAHLALFGEGGGPASVGQEAGVAAAAAAAGGGQPRVAGPDQVGQHLPLLVLDRGALGHRHPQLGPDRPAAPPALAVDAGAGTPVGMVAEGEQRRHVAVGDQPHVAALAPVSPVGPAPWHVVLTPERHRAGAAVTGLDVQPGLVDEAGHDTEPTCEGARPLSARGRRRACGPCARRT